MAEIKIFKQIIRYKLDRKSIRLCVGENIKKQRNQKGFTQTELGEQVHLSRTTVVNIEQGRQGLLVDKLYLIAAALGCEPQDLLPKMEH